MRKYAPLLFVTVAVFALLVPLSWLHGSSIASAIIGQNAGSTLGTISGINCNGVTLWCSIQAGILQLNTGNPAVTWTVIQHPFNFACGGTGTVNILNCTVTASAITAGNAVLFSEAIYGAGAVTPPSFNYASGDNFTHCPAVQTAVQYTTEGWETADCFYLLSAAGGNTSFTFSVNFYQTGPSYGMDAHLVEIHRSTGAAVFDTSALATRISCTNCAGPTLELGGSDYVYVFAAVGSTPSAVSSPYTQPQDLEPLLVEGVFAGAVNQTSYAVPLITQSPAASAAIGVIALK